MHRRISRSVMCVAGVLGGVFMLLNFFACSFSNENPQVYVALSETEISISVGESFTLTATASDGGEISWISSKTSVAEVSQDGVVTGVSAGTSTVTALSSNAMAHCTVTVEEIEPTLIWSDEFDGDSLDTAKWGYQTGTHDSYGSSNGAQFWGNNELQYYAQDAVTVSDGSLKITATREDMDDGRTYSSGRILTRDKFSFTYGYIEARMRTPAIQGIWPAFWLLPQPSSTQNDNNEYGWWAANGEIDIMEAKGRLNNVADHTLHFGNKNSSTYLTRSTPLSSSTEEWHVYGLEWRAAYIAWFVDGEEVFRVNNSEWWTSAVSKEENPDAPFDKPFYIIFNLAVGGNYDGGRVPPEDFVSADMYVDYVRVYE